MTSISSQQSGLRSLWTWILPILVAYAISALWLRWTWFFVIAVIPNAPLGIISFFDHSVKDTVHQQELLPFIAGIHIAFWSLLTVAILCRRLLPISVLTTIFSVIIVALLFTLGGCAMNFAAPHIP